MLCISFSSEVSFSGVPLGRDALVFACASTANVLTDKFNTASVSSPSSRPAPFVPLVSSCSSSVQPPITMVTNRSMIKK